MAGVPGVSGQRGLEAVGRQPPSAASALCAASARARSPRWSPSRASARAWLGLGPFCACCWPLGETSWRGGGVFGSPGSAPPTASPWAGSGLMRRGACCDGEVFRGQGPRGVCGPAALLWGPRDGKASGELCAEDGLSAKNASMASPPQSQGVGRPAWERLLPCPCCAPPLPAVFSPGRPSGQGGSRL